MARQTRQRLRIISILTLILCLVSTQAFAVSNQSVIPGTPIVFTDSGGNVVWTIGNKATNSGQVSSQYDKGAGAQPAWWEMRCQISLTGTLQLGQTIEYYIATGDGTTTDAGVGTTNATITSDQRRALTILAGTLATYQTVQNTLMYASFRNVFIPSRYFSLVMWTNATPTTQNVANTNKCSMIPMPYQMS